MITKKIMIYMWDVTCGIDYRMLSQVGFLLKYIIWQTRFAARLTASMALDPFQTQKTLLKYLIGGSKGGARP